MSMTERVKPDIGAFSYREVDRDILAALVPR